MIEQVTNLKLTAKNIESVLSKSNGELRKLRLKRKRLIIQRIDRQKKLSKEDRIESRTIKRSPLRESTDNIRKATGQGIGGLWGMAMKLLTPVLTVFGSLVAGILVNNVDQIMSAIEKIKEIFENVKNFFVGIWESVTGFFGWHDNATSNVDNLTDNSNLNIDNNITKTTPNGTTVIPDDSNSSSTNSSIEGTNNNVVGAGLAEKLFPESERIESQKGSDAINRLFGHEVNDDSNLQSFVPSKEHLVSSVPFSLIDDDENVDNYYFITQPIITN